MGEAAKAHLCKHQKQFSEENSAFNRETQTASNRHTFFLGFLILKKFLVKSDSFGSMGNLKGWLRIFQRMGD